MDRLTTFTAHEKAEKALKEMKKMTRGELNEILEQHKLWLDTNGAEGCRADLRGADLYGADLDYSCLPLWCGSLANTSKNKDRTVKVVHLNGRENLVLGAAYILNGAMQWSARTTPLPQKSRGR